MIKKQFMTAGQKLTIRRTCVCERFLHESSKYPRDGYRDSDKVNYTFHDGDVVEFVKEWFNFYGVYYNIKRVGSTDNKTYDISISDFYY